MRIINRIFNQVGDDHGFDAAPLSEFVLDASDVPVNTVAPVLSGDVEIGETLTVDNGTFDPATDGHEYLWRRGITTIPGAVLSTYITVPSDDGEDITALVRGRVGDEPWSDYAESNPLSIVYHTPVGTNYSPTAILENSAVISISYSTLFAVENDPNAESVVVTFTPITGVTNNTELRRIFIDPSLTGILTDEVIVVTGTNSGGFDTADLTLDVEAEFVPDPAPVNDTPAELTVASGVLGEVGNEVTAEGDTWTPSPDETEYRIVVNGIAVEDDVYTPIVDDVDFDMVPGVRARLTDGLWSDWIDGDPVTVVAVPTVEPAPTNTVIPALSVSSGTLGKVGNITTVSNGTWTPTPDEYEQRMKIDGTIVSNNNSYTPTSGDVGLDLTGEVRARVTDGDWSTYVASNATTVIAVTPPNYIGGLTDRNYEEDIAITPYNITSFFEGPSLQYTATGLPTGLSLHLTTGVISGTPTTPAVATLVTVTATNVDGSDDGTFFITITVADSPGEALDYDGLAPDTLEGADLPYNFSQHISGPGPVTYSSADLPTGVSIHPTTGVISGTIGDTVTSTIVASNGAFPDIEVDIDFEEEAAVAPSAFADGDWSVTNPATSGDIVLAWTTLPSNGGSAITDIQYKVDAGAYTTTGSTSANDDITISGLTDDVEYDFQIRAVNVIGNGTASSTKSQTPTAPSTAEADATNAPVVTDPLSAAIGSADADRVVFAATYVAGAGLTTAAPVTINGGTPTLIGAYTITNRSCEFYSHPVTTGTTTTIDRTPSTSDNRTAAFRVIGYEPIVSTPVVGASQNGTNTTNSVVTPTVPAGGCVLIVTKNYETITPNSGSLVGTLSSNNDRATTWFNGTGSPVAVQLTASTVVSASQKFIWCCILQAI
jgi:hypothetical protein